MTESYENNRGTIFQTNYHAYHNSKLRRCFQSGKIRIHPIGILLVLFVILLAAVFVYWSLYTYYILEKPLKEVYDSSESFKGIEVDVKFKNFLKSDVLIFNLKKVPKDAEISAPFRLFLSYTLRLEKSDLGITTIEIQYNGKTKFILSGEALHILAAQTYYKQPLEIALEFPPLLKNPEGNNPFRQPYGDPQYVYQKKIHNFQDFVKIWFLVDMKKQEEESKGKAKSTPTPKSPNRKNQSPESSPKPLPEAPPESPFPSLTDIPEIPDEPPRTTPEVRPTLDSKQKSPETPSIEPDAI